MGEKSVVRTLAMLVFVLALLLPGVSADEAAGADGDVTIISLHVNSTADSGDGLCDAAECTLREAILAANATPGMARITVPAGVYALLAEGIAEDDGAAGDLDVSGDLELFGAGPGQTILDGAGRDRVLHVHGDVRVTIADLTIHNGFADAGAGIKNDSGVLHIKNTLFHNNLVSGLFEDDSTGRNEGGGIFNGGALTLVNVTFDGNRTDQDYFGDGIGGAIVNYGSVRATRTTFTNGWAGAGGGIYNLGADVVLNDCTFSRTFARFFGGAIYNETGSVRVNGCVAHNSNEAIANLGMMTIAGSSVRDNVGDRVTGGIWNLGTLRLSASTLSGNSGDFGSAVVNNGVATLTNVTVSDNVQGWGIFNWNELQLVNSTITGNVGDEEGGGLHNQSGGNTTLRATIVAGNSGDDCSGAITSLGYNLDGDGSCLLAGKGDLTADPLLGPLQDNGGPTTTHAPQPESPAVDHIPAELCPVHVDQRGVNRPQGPACDVGAVEIEP